VRRPLVSLLATMLLLAGGGRAAARPAPNILVFGLTQDAGLGFNTALACCNSTGSAWIGNVEALRGAFVQDAKGDWAKDLVSSAEADTRGVSYTIRPDAYWYWGGRKVPVTYHDFVYTLQQIDDPSNDLAERTGYSNLDPARFTHTGDKQVRFFWRTTNCSPDFPCGPYADWPLLFAQLYPSFALKGLDFDKIWTSCICGNDGKPVADGPYYLASYVPGQGAVMKANPYFHDRAKIAEIDFKVISDPALLAEAMRSGQVDAILPPFTTDLLALRSVPGITYELAPIYALEHYDLRETKGSSNVLLRAPWMRQAIMLALNRQSMIDAVYGQGTGLKPVDNLLFYPGEDGYRPDFSRWNYNPAKAIALLRQHCTGGPTAPDPATTKVWQCAGLPAVFRYTWPSTAPARTVVEQVAKANLKAVGIAITERPLPGSVIFTPSGIPSGDFDLGQYAGFTSGDPGDWYDEYRCSGPSNWTGYCSHTVDTLLKAANRELDPEQRAVLFQRADAIMATEVPSIPLFQKLGVLVHKTALVGPGPGAGVFYSFWNVENWRWKR
jgi:ABC-type transport system substrate-binding protein